MAACNKFWAFTKARARKWSRQKRCSSCTGNTHPNEIAVGMEVVGHVAKLMAQWLTKFLKRSSNSGTVVISWKRINRGAEYGLELPCEFRFQGDKYSCDWLEEKLKKENFDVLKRKTKKTYRNVTFICTVLFRLKHCLLSRWTEPILLEISFMYCLLSAYRRLF